MPSSVPLDLSSAFVPVASPRNLLSSCKAPLDPDLSPSSPPTPSSKPRRQSRVGIDADRFQRLKHLSSHKFGTATSTLCNIIFSTYLDEMERRYFGRPRASALAPLAQDRRPYDAVLFDMDGVLCDSEHISRDTAVELFRVHYKTEVQSYDFIPFTGTGEVRFLEGVANLYGIKDFDGEDAKRKFFDIYLNGGYLNLLQPFAGAIKLVEGVRSLGLKVAVASSADRIKVDANLKAIGLPPESFDFVTSSDFIERKKPFPDIFLRAAEELGVEPKRCVVIEDAVAGVQAARAAGMRCVAVATSTPEDDLLKADAALVRKDPASILWEDIFGEDVFVDQEPGPVLQAEHLSDAVEQS